MTTGFRPQASGGGLAPFARIAGAAALAAATIALPAARSSQDPSQRPVFRAGANFVTVDVYPTRDDRLVEGLTAADFEVSEDGKPQKIEAFDFVRIEPGNVPDAEKREPRTQEEGNEQAADPRSRVFVLYLDPYHVTVEGSRRARGPLSAMLNRLLAPNDLFGVMTPLLRPTDLTLARRTVAIEDQLTRLWMWGARDDRNRRSPAEDLLDTCFTSNPVPRDPEPNWLVNDGAVRRVLADVLIERYREDLILASLERLVPYLGLLREARTSLLVLSDGWVLFEENLGLSNEAAKAPNRLKCNSELMRLAALDDRMRLRLLIETANRNNVSFYPVSLSGLQGFDTPISERIEPRNTTNETVLQRDLNRLRDRSSGLRTLAENTDGVAVVDTNDLTRGLNRIVADVSAYYLLGYYSTNAKLDGKYRSIKVKVTKPGIGVKARRGYVARKEGDAPPASSATKPAAGPTPIDEALGPLQRLRPMAELFAYGIATVADLAIVVELATGQAASGKWAQGAEVQVAVTGASGGAVGKATGRIDPSGRSVLVRVPLDPSTSLAGPWHVRASIGAADDRVEEAADIATTAGPLLGAPLMFRATPAARSPLRPVADFQFRRTERVHVEWAIRKPLDRRDARLLDRKGQPLAVGVTVTEREASPGQVSLAADVALGALAEGDYLVEVTAGSGAETERVLVAFRVVR